MSLQEESTTTREERSSIVLEFQENRAYDDGLDQERKDGGDLGSHASFEHLATTSHHR